MNDLTITSLSAAYKIPNLLVNRGLTLHTQQNCLSCYKLLEDSSSIQTTPKTSPIPKALKGVIESFSSIKNVTFDQKSSETKEPFQNKRNNASISKESLVDMASSPNDKLLEAEKGVENIASDENQNDMLVLEVLKRREILKLVGCMNATVGAKTAEQSLLR